MSLFKTVSPVCPVLEMETHVAFWQSLGFKLQGKSAETLAQSDYAVIARDGAEFHLQTFTVDQLKMTQTMAVRVELGSIMHLRSLYKQWDQIITISAPLDVKPWGTEEFGFFDPAGTPFFFYVDH